jgi:hypothetical protein
VHDRADVVEHQPSRPFTHVNHLEAGGSQAWQVLFGARVWPLRARIEFGLQVLGRPSMHLLRQERAT